MNTYRKQKPFENSAQIGAYADVSFDIIGDVEIGTERLRFDTRIHYVEQGKGIPLLLVHGIGQSLYTWRHTISFFANRGYRVIAPDLIGFGYSGHPNIYYTVEEQSLVLRAFMEAIGLDYANVAAFSTGCLCTLCIAAEYPDMIESMVLVSPGGPNEHYPFSFRALTTWAGHKLFSMLVSESAVRNLLYGMYFDATKLTDDVVAGYAGPYRSKDARETLVISLMHYDDAYARSLLKSIRQPALVFSGMDDRVHTEEMMRVYAVTIPGARHIRMRNCGHFVHEEKHAKFNSEALAFFKDPNYVGYGRTLSM